MHQIIAVQFSFGASIPFFFFTSFSYTINLFFGSEIISFLTEVGFSSSSFRASFIFVWQQLFSCSSLCCDDNKHRVFVSSIYSNLAVKNSMRNWIKRTKRWKTYTYRKVVDIWAGNFVSNHRASDVGASKNCKNTSKGICHRLRSIPHKFCEQFKGSNA